MSKRFRHEDVSAVPSGWRVRTVTHGDHRVRVAFPPGRKNTNPGRLVSILHPVKEGNPCQLRSANPAELLVMGANPPRRMSNLPKAKVETYMLVSRITGKPIRKATRVIFADGKKVDFIERLPKARAVRAAMDQLGKNPAELLVMGANPRIEVVHGENPPVEEIAEEFTGSDVKYIDVYNEPHVPTGRYAQLGPLVALFIKPNAGGQVLRIGAPEGSRRKGVEQWAEFWNGQPPMIVVDSSTRQIYFVAGCQDITGLLGQFDARDRGDGRLELGQAREIHYWGVKHHIGDDDTEDWRHKFGEENGSVPVVLFDTRHKRLLLEGGDYRIEGPWMHN